MFPLLKVRFSARFLKRLFCGIFNMQIIWWPNGSQLWPKPQMTMPNALCKRSMRNLFKSQVDNNATRPTVALAMPRSRNRMWPWHLVLDLGLGLSPPPRHLNMTHRWQLLQPRLGFVLLPALGLPLMMRAHCAHLTFGLLISLACGQARPEQGRDRAGPGPGPSTAERRHNFLQMNNFCATHTHTQK